MNVFENNALFHEKLESMQKIRKLNQNQNAKKEKGFNLF